MIRMYDEKTLFSLPRFRESECSKDDELEWFQINSEATFSRIFRYLGFRFHRIVYLPRLFLLIAFLSGSYASISIIVFDVEIPTLCPQICEQKRMRSFILMFYIIHTCMSVFALIVPQDNTAIQNSWISLSFLNLKKIHGPISKNIWKYRPLFILLFLTIFLTAFGVVQRIVSNLHTNNHHGFILLCSLLCYLGVSWILFTQKTEELFNHIILMRHTIDLLIRRFEVNSNLATMNLENVQCSYRKFSKFNEACDRKWSKFLLLGYPFFLICSIFQVYFLLSGKKLSVRIIFSNTLFTVFDFSFFIILSKILIEVSSGNNKIWNMVYNATLHQNDPMLLVEVRLVIIFLPANMKK